MKQAKIKVLHFFLLVYRNYKFVEYVYELCFKCIFMFYYI